MYEIKEGVQFTYSTMYVHVFRWSREEEGVHVFR